MWDGPRPGPRGPLLRGEPRGDMPNFRGRNPTHMGHCPPMPMHRFDRPTDMRSRDMEPMEMRGREPQKDFFRPREEGDINRRGRYDMEMRNKAQGPPDFMGPGRPLMDMGGRDMKPRGLREMDGSFMDMRDRDRFQGSMSGFNEGNMDSRRRHPMNMGGRGDGFREGPDRDRPRMGGFNMDMPPRDRERMDFERRNAPPSNSRGRFDSDMDFRNRPRPSGDLRDRERSPPRYGDNDGTPMDVRGRQDMSPDFGGPSRPKFRSGEGNFREQDLIGPREPPMGFQGREEPMGDWRSRDKMEQGSFGLPSKGDSPLIKGRERFPLGGGREGSSVESSPSHFSRRDQPPIDFPPDGEKGYGFHHPGRDTPNWERNPYQENQFGTRERPSFGRNGPPEPPRSHMDPPQPNSNKSWPREQDLNQDERGGPPYPRGPDSFPGRNFDHNGSESNTSFEEPKHLPPDQRQEADEGHEEYTDDCRDQDYRDIDYRTGSGHPFSYELRDEQAAEKISKEVRPVPPQKYNEPASQDQDYRSGASVKEKVSNAISITGIPKTATMEQILGAFATRDGVPMQGMKIKNVVPGYSYDTAYVEFLILEDAVHFMESNQGALKVGNKMALMRYVQPDKNGKESQPLRHKDDHHPDLPLNSPPQMTTELPEMSSSMPLAEALTSGQWQRSSDLTPEEWQQQMDQQMKQQQQHQHPQPETQVPRNTRLPLRPMDPIFKESKTMILKNVKPTTKVETILKALDPYAYLEDKNVRLVKGKPVGSKCFCFVDMETHEEVARLVEVLIKPPPLIIDGARVYAEIAKPLKNQTFKRDGEKTRPSLLGLPLELIEQNFYNQQPMGASALIQATDHGMAADQLAPGMAYMDPSVDNSYLTSDPQASVAGMGTSGEGGDAYSYDTDNQDMSNYLYDATSGFYYDPQTTLYYDPTSRYFYNSQTQQYLYWDSVTKAYIPVQGYTSDTQPPVADMSVSAASAPALPTVLESAVTLAAPPVPSTAAPAATDQPGAPETAQEGKKIADGTAERKEEEEGAARPEKKEKDEKPKSLAAFKIMKDMERWAKIQNRQKDTVRAPSPVLKAGGMDDRKASKSADAAFAIFERKGTAGDEFFKKPLTPMKKDEKSLKKPMGSLGLLVADYGAGSDEEEEEKHDPPRVVQPSQPEEKEKDDKLTDWKKMACLLCRRQFPNKDALVRHQQLSDLHKQNMEIHLKIKRSKKELEALEHQEKQLNTRERVSNSSPEAKRKKFQNSWPGGSREMHNKVGERPGLGAEPVERKKKEHVVWDHATYKQAVRKAMFARYKELE